jgi:hypothetical protein
MLSLDGSVVDLSGSTLIIALRPFDGQGRTARCGQEDRPCQQA